MLYSPFIDTTVFKFVCLSRSLVLLKNVIDYIKTFKLGESPGLGVEVDFRAVNKYRVQ